VIGRVDVPRVPHVARHGAVAPAAAAQEERARREQPRWTEEELFDTRFAVGKPVGEQRQIDLVVREWVDGMVGLGIERVVVGAHRRAPSPR